MEPTRAYKTEEMNQEYELKNYQTNQRANTQVTAAMMRGRTKKTQADNKSSGSKAL